MKGQCFCSLRPSQTYLLDLLPEADLVLGLRRR